MTQLVQICVMAYNLEKEIYNSLTSIIAASDELNIRVFVMVNGCKDQTLKECQRFAEHDRRVIPVDIKLGDKANAWNEFVYNFYQAGAIPVFLDGDLIFEQNAINHIVTHFNNQANVNAVSSFPWAGGRSAKTWRETLLKNHEFTGNLYLLSPVFLTKIKNLNVKLPVGLIGDDSMLGYLSATDVCAGTDLPKERISVCQNAIFYYPRLNWRKYDDIRLYLRRRVRYSMRKYQQNEIVKNLKAHGYKAMPEKAVDAFIQNPTALTLSFNGLNTLFDWIAISKMNQEINKKA
ncbi:glycosyltransferase family A protein [Paraglaciecola sp.]|uniref:glycosyltransferase family A protein n=1 Tax=Paraglaciecola sp. TaxID=1920173 RepID=UPI00273E3FC1|nr:glycosyltransferase family A protein [Paraglaciecola sp.]MDP5030333.1 glycosyltransferase family 2 protein [Paraglaciecola sp.]